MVRDAGKDKGGLRVIVSSVITYYRRPQNLEKVIQGIRSQSVGSELIVWDNSPDEPIKDFFGMGIYQYFYGGKNSYCLPKYSLIKNIETDYVFNTDDDLKINDKCLFEKFIEFSYRHPQAVIGWNGRVFDKDINWDKAYSFPGHGWVDFDESESILCDVINFGVSFFPTGLLKGLELNPYCDDEFKVAEEQFRNGDDIWISAVMEKARIEKRVMPFHLKPLFEWLDEGGYALSKMSNHMVIRDGLCKRFFMGKYK